MRKIQKNELMDSSLQKQQTMVLEDLDVVMKEMSNPRISLDVVENFTESLKEQVNTSREKRKELSDKLKEKEEQRIDNKALQDKTYECEKLARENAILKNEMQSIVMKLI